MSEFPFEPAECVPFRDKEAVARVRAIKREDITKHPNPDFKISVMSGEEMTFRWLWDMFHRIVSARDEGRKCVLITPQPWPVGYSRLAFMLNTFKVDCKHLHTFNMDEYADQDGHIAPETWKFGFMYSMKNSFYRDLDPELRPPEDQIQGLSDATIDRYGDMLSELGEAECCYSGPGWTGHLAFIEPDAPEFDAPLEEWMQMGPRIATLSPFTIAQNSMHGYFGASGDLTAVPPKAATIGPAQVVRAGHRIDMNAITVDGSRISWQRLATRLCVHGPVTPKLPTSIHQKLRTDCWISEEVAQDIEPRWDIGY